MDLVVGEDALQDPVEAAPAGGRVAMHEPVTMQMLARTDKALVPIAYHVRMVFSGKNLILFLIGVVSFRMCSRR